MDRATLVRELKVLNKIKEREFFDVEELNNEEKAKSKRPGKAYIMWWKERERRLASYHSRDTLLRQETDISWYMSCYKDEVVDMPF
ncbi:MAG: hypothetical protein F6K55_37455 [Moorea sp. SIO4A3]|nr:hypothetical protein [Moorena sp. SIO4A3]